jgi:hypothetical protein
VRAAGGIGVAAARFYAPLIVLAALSLLVLRAPGGGAGFVAGVLFAMAMAVHLIVFGAAAARAAFPPAMARVLLCMGLVAAVIGAGAPRLPGAATLAETGLFAATAAGAALILLSLAGRVPTLRDQAN